MKKRSSGTGSTRSSKNSKPPKGSCSPSSPKKDADLFGEYFAAYIANRRAVRALDPYFTEGYTIIVERPPEAYSDVIAVTIKHFEMVVEPEPNGPREKVKEVWMASGRGKTINEAAEDAAKHAREVDDWHHRRNGS